MSILLDKGLPKYAVIDFIKFNGKPLNILKALSLLFDMTFNFA